MDDLLCQNQFRSKSWLKRQINTQSRPTSLLGIYYIIVYLSIIGVFNNFTDAYDKQYHFQQGY